MNPRILIVDDDEVSCRLFAEVLEGEGYDVHQAHSGEDALDRIREGPYDLLLVDVQMPGITGIDVTRTLRRDHPTLPVVVMTAFGSIETAVEAIQEGAYDYISKPMNLEELKKIVSRALGQRELQTQAGTKAQRIDAAEQQKTVIGRSRAMVEVFKMVARAAPTKSTVVIVGESGTGKEVIARAIHQHSSRAQRPFVAVDCGALTQTLLESELFGHVRGAFTGAVADKKGVFQEANGGTCFLDEIGNISPNMQAKLLRVLQEEEVRPVGGKEWIKVDARVLAATNKDLDELMKNGVFREDLYYRLKVVTIRLPPIRERPEDIVALAQNFLRRYSQAAGKAITGISEEAMERLQKYSWPGNIRQLENVIEQAVVLSNQPILTVDDLAPEIREDSAPRSPFNLSRSGEFFFSDTPNLEEVKKRYVLHVMSRTEGNVSRAAKILDIDRRSLYRMLVRWKIEPFKEQ
ncbi:MAG: sigma-54-dependent transcriptional regulator [Candidatus Binatia bacterium]